MQTEIIYLVAGFIIGVFSTKIYPWSCLLGFHRWSYYRVHGVKEGVVTICDDCGKEDWIIKLEGGGESVSRDS